MAAARAAGHDVPRRAQLGLVGLGVVLALVGQHVAAPAAALAGLGPDQALVLQLLERRVDRAGAGPPDSPAALADLLDDLVAVHRLLGQQGQRRRANVTAPGPRPAHPRLARPRTHAVESGRPRHPLGEPAAPVTPAPAGTAAPALVLAAVPLALFVCGMRPAGHLPVSAAMPPELFVSHLKSSLNLPAPTSLRRSRTVIGVSDRSKIYRYCSSGNRRSGCGLGGAGGPADRWAGSRRRRRRTRARPAGWISGDLVRPAPGVSRCGATAPAGRT